MWPIQAWETTIRGATGNARDARPGDLFVALPFADGDAHAGVEEALAAGAALALVSKGWPRLGALAPELRMRCVVVEDVLASFRAFAATFRERFSYPVAAVAGSNGKTTTKDMLAALLSGPGYRVVKTPGTDNGFVGLPQTLCAREHRAADPPHAVVLEIGIDAKGAMVEHARMIAPDVALISALGPEHLGGLGDTTTAVEEELRLFAAAPRARRVVPWSDPEIQSRPWLVREGDIAVLEAEWLSRGDAPQPNAGAVLAYRAALSGRASELTVAWYPSGDRQSPAWQGRFIVPMPGAHNARNAAVAIAAALLIGRAPEEIAAGWQTFEPPPWRSRVTPLARGALLYDDCFNASPLSMAAALAALRDPAWADRPKLAVLGDMLDLGTESAKWHRELIGALTAIGGLRLFLFGRAMLELGEELSAAGRADLIAGRLEAEEDPVALVADLALPEGAIVLVKGSRGMRMERVSRYLELAYCPDPAAAERALSQWLSTVFVAGSHGTLPAARMVARALQCFGPAVGLLGSAGTFIDSEPIAAPAGAPGIAALLRRCIARGGTHAVVELAHEHILTAASERVFVAGIFTGLSEEDLPSDGDAETHLAQKAQLFIGRRGLLVAVLNGDDPASELIAEVLSPETRVLRYGTAGAALGPVDLLAAAVAVSVNGTRIVLDGAADFPEVIEIREQEAGAVQGIMAALLIVRALGGDPRRAAPYLC